MSVPPALFGSPSPLRRDPILTPSPSRNTYPPSPGRNTYPPALGNTAALVDLGWLHYNGEGVEEDPERAVGLYEQAAARGNVSAMFNLGIAYADGHGVPRSVEKAREWYARAAAMGHDEAATALAELDNRARRARRGDRERVGERAFIRRYRTETKRVG